MELAPKCTFSNPKDCSEKANAYVKKWDPKTQDEKKTEIERLQKLIKQTMKPELKKWVRERVWILMSGVGSDEL